LAACADLKVVQDQLGHSTITLTVDTYTSVLPQTPRAAAEHTAALLFPRPPGARQARVLAGSLVHPGCGGTAKPPRADSGT
jgi:hypothetical protein